MRSLLFLVAFFGYAACTVNPTCASDNCLRAVISRSSSASTDCSSFFLKTFTPATVTQTATVVTQTVAPAAITDSNTITITSLLTDSDTATIQTATVETITSVSTILETETVVVTTTTFTTVYVVPGEGGAAPASRDVKPWDHKLTNSIVARQVTVAPSKVPTYASACSGTVRYSSACSCIGISQKTTTVAAPTTTTTKTITTTVTPSATIQVTSTDISSVTTTVESTLVITNTVLTTLVNTITTDSTISTTVTASAAVTDTCASFVLEASGAGVTGQFIQLTDTEDETVQSTSFTPEFLNAAQFTIDSSSRLFNGPYGANTDLYTGPAEVFFDTLGSFSDVIYLTCSTTGPFSGPLTCTGYSGATIFQLCPSGYRSGPANEPGSGLSIGTTLDSNCQAISFTAVLSCT